MRDTDYAEELGEAGTITFPSGSEGRIERPVSYTHLDVYKRQV